MNTTSKDIVNFIKTRVDASDDFDHLFEDPETWTSFERIEVALATEEHFDVQFSPEELTDLRSPKDIVVAVERALGITSETTGA